MNLMDHLRSLSDTNAHFREIVELGDVETRAGWKVPPGAVPR